MFCSKSGISFVLLILITFSSFAKDDKKELQIQKTQNAPNIDGKLNDEVWNNCEVASEFIQESPFNGRPSPRNTEVMFTYDNEAFYVGAYIYDNPDSLLTRIGNRDNLGSADNFGVYIDPFNDAKSAYGFFVSCVGVQQDMRANEDGWRDRSWDAVWESTVKMVDDGYIVEMKIPYSALRFPKTEVQTWGVNVFRSIERHQMKTTWNYINNKIHGFINQAGEVSGIEDVKSPTRLSFTPYITGYVENNNGQWGNSIKGGLDLKYGISESFTLDMMLIPDFGQIQSDDKQLNLSPFELYYNEKRPFFTEGTELFSKANLFYSRRIGSAPRNLYKVRDDLNEQEEVVDNPTETQIVNVSKITGKTSKGLSIGFLNGITLPANATIVDSVNNTEREFSTQASTNYNILVFDKTIGKYSSVSLVNTNVYTKKDVFMANVSGTEFKIADSENKYAIRGTAALSQRNEPEFDTDYGHTYQIEAGKISGNFQFSVEREVFSDSYNPNDLGFLHRNNYINSDIRLDYSITEPKGIMKGMRLMFRYEYEELYEPRKYIQQEFSIRNWIDFMNNSFGGYHISGSPGYSFDYYEPRMDYAKFREEKNFRSSIWYGTDRNKDLSAFTEINYSAMDLLDNRMYSVQFRPSLRIGDKFSFETTTLMSNNSNNVGYAGVSEINDTIYFESRNIVRLMNIISSNYSINSDAYVSLRVRHDWTRKSVNDYHILETNGTLTPTNEYTKNNNETFNAFTIDAGLTWNFAPGSQMSMVYKKVIYSSNDKIIPEYKKNLKEIWNSDQLNSISLKILYYLDYHYFKSLKHTFSPNRQSMQGTSRKII